MKNIKRLIIIDPGFSIQGHHYSTFINIGSECAKRNIECIIFSQRNIACNCTLEYKISGVETAHLYPVMTEVIYSQMSYNNKFEFFLIYSDIFADELESHITPYLDNDVRILCHTANAVVIYAVYKWFMRSRKNMPSIVLNIQHSFDDNEEDFMQYRAALSKIFDCKSVKIYGSNVPLCRKIAAASGRPVRILPLPLRLPPIVKRNDNPIPVFCIAGEVREEKNLQIIPDAVRLYFAAGGRGRFTIQLQPTKQVCKLAQHNLPLLRDAFPNKIELFIGPLYGDDYYRHIACSDAVLLPYAAHVYRNRISQVALEAAALGVSCITTRYSSMEEELERLDNGSVFMEQSDPEALAGAMLNFEQNLADNRAKAAAAGEVCRAFHNADTYFAVAADAETVRFPDYACLNPPAGGHFPHNPPVPAQKCAS
ncbi:MAG: glycosyltransferase [Desulfovibrio sp.]|jgi:glycosyltransferase involved in cell wall biosynthesis|nr:glycosyltransferase [Desulfovibrio sp.]